MRAKRTREMQGGTEIAIGDSLEADGTRERKYEAEDSQGGLVRARGLVRGR